MRKVVHLSLGYPKLNSQRENDDEAVVAILVLGITGSGKSTLISLLADEDVHVGHELTSGIHFECCGPVSSSRLIFADTSKIQKFKARIEKRDIFLIDTPGFDDTTRSDTEILSEIAVFLDILQKSRTKLIGILYCHRITDIRVTGQTRKSIVMLEKLCGSKAFGHVVIVTTMWDALEDKDVGIDRLRQLLENPKFFGDLVKGNAKHARFYPTRDQAEQLILQNLHPKSHIVLDIQRQLASGMTLEETPVGKYILEDLLEKRRKYEQELREITEALSKARERKDDDMESVLSEEERHQREMLTKVEKDFGELGRNLTELAEEENPEYASMLKRLDSTKKEREENERLRRQIAKLKKERDNQENDYRQLERAYVESLGRSQQETLRMQRMDETLQEMRLSLRAKDELIEIEKLQARSRRDKPTLEFVVRGAKKLLGLPS